MKIFVSAIALAVAMPALAQTAAPATPTAAEADAFVAQVEKEYADFGIYGAQVAWVNATYITEDTDALSARVGTQGTEMGVRFAKQAALFAKAPGLSYDTKRKLDFLRNGLTLPAPSTEGAAAELNTIATRLNSSYGKGKGTLRGEVINGSDIEEAMGRLKDVPAQGDRPMLPANGPEQFKEMWTSWHTNVGKPMKADYARMVEIANQGARELGYADTGAMWRSGYDMDPDAFAALTDKLWAEVKPLYDALHCYTRAKLNAKYGDAVQKATGPIRADLLGNMWAQEWGDIYDVVAPPGAGDIGYEIGDLLKAKGFVETDPKETDPAKRGKWEKEVFKIGEGFFSSLGFDPLPKTFWERTQFIKPLDREVICHASAWDLDSKDDLRVKMCTKINTGDFVTVHHELGHNYYRSEERRVGKEC